MASQKIEWAKRTLANVDQNALYELVGITRTHPDRDKITDLARDFIRQQGVSLIESERMLSAFEALVSAPYVAVSNDRPQA